MTAQTAWSFLRPRLADEVAVVGPDVGVMACGAECRHVEGDTQVAVAGLGQARLFVDAGAGLVFPRIKASHGDPLLGLHVVREDQQFAEALNGAGVGDAGDADEQFEGLLEVFISGDKVEGLLPEGRNLSVEESDELL